MAINEDDILERFNSGADSGQETQSLLSMDLLFEEKVRLCDAS